MADTLSTRLVRLNYCTEDADTGGEDELLSCTGRGRYSDFTDLFVQTSGSDRVEMPWDQTAYAVDERAVGANDIDGGASGPTSHGNRFRTLLSEEHTKAVAGAMACGLNIRVELVSGLDARMSEC